MANRMQNAVYFQYIQGVNQNEIVSLLGSERLPDGRIAYTLSDMNVVSDDLIYPLSRIGGGDVRFNEQTGEYEEVPAFAKPRPLAQYKVIQVPYPDRKCYNFFAVDANDERQFIKQYDNQGRPIGDYPNPRFNPSLITSFSYENILPIPNNFVVSYVNFVNPDEDEDYDLIDLSEEEVAEEMVITPPQMIVSAPMPTEPEPIQTYEEVVHKEEPRMISDIEEELITRILKNSKKKDSTLSIGLSIELPVKTIVDVVRATFENPDEHINRMCDKLVQSVSTEDIKNKMKEIILDLYTKEEEVKPKKEKPVRLDDNKPREVGNVRAVPLNERIEGKEITLEEAMKVTSKKNEDTPLASKREKSKDMTPEEIKARRIENLRKAREAKKLKALQEKENN